MKILNTNDIKKELITEISTSTIENNLHILAMNPSEEELSYRDYIIKRCREFEIGYFYKKFDLYASKEDIIAYTNSCNNKDGFIILLPFDKFDGISYLKENIKLKDVDAFTYKSMGHAMAGNSNYLPATPKSVVKYLEKNEDLKSKNIVIANRTELIGLPLSTYLMNKGATVTVINSETKNPIDYIKNSHIFISAIGRADYYDKSYFKDGQTIIDVGTSIVNGKIKGDVNYEDLEDLDVKVLTCKKGIGAITTLTLLQGLID
ncbi:bifunctional 5,10-methylenetetrahydrofolate dehydrogenase/5,10-methenyltetrahydrofolate cyclohydrolase [Anaerococcus sp.]|jgi:tetrahydrofolate dehydrogenase/cyclohydrolase, NAD(P)-binding domain protein|uniref:bifunctional 5,10-methylenetetrahydrofolate dehydrogenase/5,10-methenyltetrahydrofolate cyclohydrolase n=1 Tax=Anaerococcus sp. TaxID=1872515 RepID=UPI0028FE203A|nr:bifunctional 5,10-methylenetetrahydrofolate dehydrogenase/5,10-methenyltetrahydrofolate cyclohydrolase [Anaerococcus sp.]MDU1829298.1 bifunctional 5,10-methylenetetrahydrofolate dehydrogenase/5,10-methenyltetrahydrofolate cyclohydrolase [Anaerococcus sp.]MDU1864067.1 bifunctional 5,10-methylenetetrahydrofolate dehydrogenase/5,10-methenyltetrahydrofolate cyclohydrolase [Anaerococcus sp.]